MTDRTDVARGRDIVARWCRLAEQRLEHLTELFETGRWRRYHTESAFLENIKEAKAAVETWRGLLTREASLENRPCDISWLGRPRSTLPNQITPRLFHFSATQPAPVASERSQHAIPASSQAILVTLQDVPPMPVVDAPASAPQSPAAMAELEPVSAPALDLTSDSDLQPITDNESALAIDLIAAVQERYPLLRNSL